MRAKLVVHIAAVAATGVLIGTAALAAEEAKTETPKSSMQQEIEAHGAAMRNLAHKMMGHVSLASLALDVDLPDAAQDHLASARTLIAQLQSEAPRVIEKTKLKYGKLSYEFEDQARNHYVPVIDDVFLLSDYEETYHAFREADLEEIDAGIVEVTISVDLREVDKALAAAEAKLAAKQPKEASVALRDVFKNAITDENVVTDPIWAIHDNLALARNLIRQHQYDGARFALERARKRLEKLEKGDAEEKDKADFKKMQDEITQLTLQLKKDDPTLVESIDAKYQAWMSKVRGWFSLDLDALD